MRYQLIDTLTGEIVNQTSTNPGFAGLTRKPPQTPRKTRKHRIRTPIQVKQDAMLSVVLAVVLVASIFTITH